MTRKLFIRAIPILLLCLLSAKAFAEVDMRWYVNKAECANSQITIRNYCIKAISDAGSTYCTKQSMTIEKPDGTKVVKENLLEKQAMKDEFLTAWNVACVPVDTTTSYLFFKLANGGNCPACEATAVMDINGNWKYFGKHWFVSKDEKRQIIKRDDEWYHVEGVYLRNNIEDIIQK